MKKQLLLFLTMSLILTSAACGTSRGGGKTKTEGDETVTFQGAILEIHDGYYLVEPVEGSVELNSADQITIPMTNMNPLPEPKVGDILEIEYDGSIGESYPAQIANVYSIRVVGRKEDNYKEALPWALKAAQAGSKKLCGIMQALYL